MSLQFERIADLDCLVQRSSKIPAEFDITARLRC